MKFIKETKNGSWMIFDWTRIWGFHGLKLDQTSSNFEKRKTLAFFLTILMFFNTYYLNLDEMYRKRFICEIFLWIFWHPSLGFPGAYSGLQEKSYLHAWILDQVLKCWQRTLGRSWDKRKQIFFDQFWWALRPLKEWLCGSNPEFLGLV